jgi:ABC-2 type transport system ATP-binding protein
LQNKDALVVEGVTKSYGERPALQDVSFSIPEGEFWVLLGANGAGKTTLFQLLTGLFMPDAGRIRVMEHDMANAAPKALAKLGIVFQYPTIDLELSPRANLVFSAGLQGMSRALARTRIAEVLGGMGLACSADEKAGRLSGGNRRRVELARALLHQPRILLMDEPTVGLDPASRLSLLSTITDLCRHDRITVLWATHLCAEANNADRVIVLDRGRVARRTTPANLCAETSVGTIEAAFLEITGQERVP